jgi:hypothetical protein
LKAKELIAHGEFQAWLEANAGERGYRTLAKWMKMLVKLISKFKLCEAFNATGNKGYNHYNSSFSYH